MSDINGFYSTVQTATQAVKNLEYSTFATMFCLPLHLPMLKTVLDVGPHCEGAKLNAGT